MRFVLGLGLVASLIAHVAWLNPIRSTSGFEVNDLDGDVDITVDLFEEAPPEPVKVAEPKPPGEGLDGGLDAKDAAADASAARGADAGGDSGRDGETGSGDASPDAMGDAAIASGSPDNGPKDSVGILGTAGAITAADVYVTVAINTEAIRKNSIGKRAGPLLQGLNQWHDFLQGTSIDPVRDADWVMIYGPSLRDTTKAIIVIRYSLPDAQMDAACDFMAHRYAKGGQVDTGIAGMKAWLAYADRGERLLVRPQSHMLVILPSRKTVSAEKERQLLQKISQTVYPARLKNAHEAVRVIVKKPHKAIREIPEGLSEARLRVIPGANDSATLYIEGDCSDEATCASAQRELEATLGDLGAKASVASIFTAVPAGVGKVLNEAQLSHDAKHLRMQVELTRAELQDLLTFMTGFLKSGGF